MQYKLLASLLYAVIFAYPYLEKSFRASGSPKLYYDLILMWCFVFGTMRATYRIIFHSIGLGVVYIYMRKNCYDPCGIVNIRAGDRSWAMLLLGAITLSHSDHSEWSLPSRGPPAGFLVRCHQSSGVRRYVQLMS